MAKSQRPGLPEILSRCDLGASAARLYERVSWQPQPETPDAECEGFSMLLLLRLKPSRRGHFRPVQQARNLEFPQSGAVGSGGRCTKCKGHQQGSCSSGTAVPSARKESTSLSALALSIFRNLAVANKGKRRSNEEEEPLTSVRF